MAEKTGIAWCDSTFNPWIGCSKVSPACDNCYAEALNNRMKWVGYGGNDADGIYPFRVRWGVGIERHRTSASTWRQPLIWNLKAKNAIGAWEQFKATQPGLTDAQLEAQGFHKPTRPRVFCGSLCDVFDNEVPNEWRFDLFRLIEATPHLCWLLLTKRIGNANAMLPFEWNDGGRENVLIGATICNQEEADRDIPKLLAVPAAKRFLSIEPMLGPIDLRLMTCAPLWAGDGAYAPAARTERLGLHWVICGSESGPGARRDPNMLTWVRSLRDQCVAARIPFFWKQDAINGKKIPTPELDGRTWTEVPA